METKVLLAQLDLQGRLDQLDELEELERMDSAVVPEPLEVLDHMVQLVNQDPTESLEQSE